ncbi:MAG: N-acetyltransferase [Verrucomicrobiota bacterium]
MKVREASKHDREEIQKVYASAFPASESDAVSSLACDILLEAGAVDSLSLVAEIDNSIVGHVAFSPVTFAKESDIRGYILAPLAVSEDHQKRRIGSELVECGLKTLSEKGVSVFFVYGDPNYYNRFGFEQDAAKNFVPPYTLQFPFGWQVMIRSSDDGQPPFGNIQCVTPLRDPNLW